MTHIAFRKNCEFPKSILENQDMTKFLTAGLALALLTSCASPVQRPSQSEAERDPAGTKRKNDLCVCVYGNSPEEQQGFFKAGCSLWYMANGCREKLRYEEDGTPGFKDLVSEKYRGKKVAVGFVGH